MNSTFDQRLEFTNGLSIISNTGVPERVEIDVVTDEAHMPIAKEAMDTARVC